MFDQSDDRYDDINKINKEFLETAEYYYHTFLEGPGAKTMAHLKKSIEGSLLNPSTVCDFQAEITPEQLMFIREGQQQVLRHIKNMMTYYKDNRNS